jgi:hypothetical protein
MKAAHGTYLFSICFSPTCFHLYRVRNGNANIHKGITIESIERVSVQSLNWVPHSLPRNQRIILKIIKSVEVLICTYKF